MNKDNNQKTRAEKRDIKKRKRMPVTGKQVFKLKELMEQPDKKMPRSVKLPKSGKKGRQSIRGSHRIEKIGHGEH